MSDDDIRRIVIDELRNLTPETDPATISADDEFRDALDFDSMDLLTFVIALSKRLSVDVPETDYPQVTTIAGAVAYLGARLGQTTGGRSCFGARFQTESPNVDG